MKFTSHKHFKSYFSFLFVFLHLALSMADWIILFYGIHSLYKNIDWLMKAKAFGVWVQEKGKLGFKNRTMLQVVLMHEWWKLMKLQSAQSWCRQQHLLKWQCFCSDRQMTKKCGWFASGRDRPWGRKEFCAAVVTTRNLKALEYVREDQWQMFLRESRTWMRWRELHKATVKNHVGICLCCVACFKNTSASSEQGRTKRRELP